MSAREVAIVVLQRVAQQGAYASAALDAELGRAGLSGPDVGLATEIVYGTLRALPDLDALIAARLRHGGKLDPLAQAALRTACYQLMHLSRVPPHAVVDETVRIVRAQRGQKLGGFVNAVLRALARQRPEQPRPVQRVVVPEWVRKSLEQALGEARMQALLDRRPMPPPMALRVMASAALQAAVAAIVRAQPDANVHAGAVAPRALLLRRAGNPRKLPGYAEGHFAVQEEGAQVVALALGAQPGERIADLCAGHGGKTTLLLEQVGATGRVLAVDLDARKLERIAAELHRQGVGERAASQPSALPFEHAAIDLSAGIGEQQPASFDRVLVDAPCTGLGTLHRRPELLLRVGPEDPARMAALQLAILSNAAKLVRSGGTLAYAVCSPTREEGVGVAEGFEREHADFERFSGPWPDGIARLKCDSDGILRVGPWLGDPEWGSPDAYQLVRWTRRPEG